MAKNADEAQPTSPYLPFAKEVTKVAQLLIKGSKLSPTEAYEAAIVLGMSKWVEGYNLQLRRALEAEVRKQQEGGKDAT